MKFTVRTSPAALNDVSQILTWLASHSMEGAQRWYAAYLKALRQLEVDAEVSGTAPESAGLRRPIRQKLFKTRRGRPYRLLFMFDGDVVIVLRVRGPGQSPLTRKQLGSAS